MNVNVAINGCMIRMGQELIKSSQKDKDINIRSYRK